MDRLKKAVEEAQLAFWDVIAQKFPEAKSGDFPPEATYDLDIALESAVKCWLTWNAPAGFLETMKAGGK